MTASSALASNVSAPEAPLRRASPWAALAPLAAPAATLALLLLFNLIWTDGFFRLEVRDGRLFGSLVDILKNGSQVMLLTLGMTLVIGTGGIDLSVGAIMAIAGAVAASLLAPPYGSPLAHVPIGGSVALAFAAGLLVAVLCGAWNGLLVTLLKLPPIVATLILMGAGRGVAQLLTAGQIPTVSDYDFPAFARLGGGSLAMLPVPFVVALVAVILMLLLVRRTALGLFVEAVGNNRVAARVAGINANGVRMACYVLSGTLAGVAGLIYASDIRAGDVNNAGLYLELDAILACAIGGTSLAGGRFSLLGSVLGALVIQTLTTTIYSQPNLDPAWALVIKAGVVIALCLLQSRAFRAMALRPFKAAMAGRKKVTA